MTTECVALRHSLHPRTRRGASSRARTTGHKMQTDAHAHSPHKIVPLERGDLQAQAALCSQAFWSDPLYNFLYRTCVV